MVSNKYFIPTNCTTIITNENAPHWCSINPRFLGIVLQWICSNKRMIFLIFQFREFFHSNSMVSIWTCIFPFHWFHQKHEIYTYTCERNQSKQIVINVGKIGRIHSNGFHKKTLSIRLCDTSQSICRFEYSIRLQFNERIIEISMHEMRDKHLCQKNPVYVWYDLHEKSGTRQPELMKH